MWGGIGGPITAAYIDGRAKQYPYIYSASYVTWLRSLIGKGYFGFDCVNVVKAVLWGWTGDARKHYGGAEYLSNDVPDIGADALYNACKKRSTDFSNVKVGEALWLPGHFGLYVGNGLAVEATPSWRNGVQVTAVANIGPKTGYNARTWRGHGQIPYVDYATSGGASGGAPYKEYTVKPTDTDGYWGIAKRELGDPFRFEEILSLNGLSATEPITAGQKLKLPTTDPVAPVQNVLPYGDLVIAKGASGVLVKALQIALIEQGGAEIDADGSYGPVTAAAVAQYQAAKKLKVDGVAGVETWRDILK